LKHVEKDKEHRGEYKNQENKVAMIDSAGNPVEIVFDTTLAYLTPKEMQEIVEWTQLELIEKKYHPLLIIGNFLVEFLQIHPFTDGNGRLSRILTNLLLLQQGFEYMPYVSHEKLVEDNKPEYYIALRQSQKTFGTEKETITPWLRFLLNMLLEQSRRAVELLSHEQIEKLLSPQQEIVWKYLEGVRESTPIAISNATNVPRPTINQVLTKLLRLKKIERIGSGRGTRYRVI
jgi:Fic family protein